MPDSSQTSQRALILAPYGSDAQIASQVLRSVGIDAHDCADAEELAQEIKAYCGVVIVSEEGLTPEVIQRLRDALDDQPPWSDLPIILLTSVDIVKATEIFSKSGNISLLERPFSQLTLIRSVETALRARRQQYQVRELLKELRHAKTEAEKANLAKTQFLANMSHEIRTPVGAIIGFIDLLKDPQIDQIHRQKYMDIIDRNSQQLLSLIDDILDLSKVEAGKTVIENLRIDLNDYLSDLTMNYQLRSAEKGLSFQMRIGKNVPRYIHSDPVRIRQILTNIVGNAIKFTQQGQVTLSVGYQEPFIEFEVRDTGIGLTAKQAKKLFQPFVQADPSTTRKFGGTGLGLVLSRRLAEALGGSLDLVSTQPGQGTTFLIRVKPTMASSRQFVQRENQPTSPPLQEAAEQKILKGLNVLLVEDSEDNQTLISLYLKNSGAQIDVKSNGAEGVEAALQGAYDLILMDVQMPIMDGHEATKKLRDEEYSKPIIALTAHAMNEERKKCFASGFTDYLTKPVHRGRLIDVLSRYRPQHL